MTTRDDNPTETVDVITNPEALRARLVSRAVVHLYGRDATVVRTLAAGDSVVVGRDRPADVVVADPSLSRSHARFSFDGDRVFVVDLASKNGTRKNGEAVVGDVGVSVSVGDDILVGNVVAAVHVARGGEKRASAGIESHQRLVECLRDEVDRARFFKRSAALLAISSASDSHVGGFTTDVQKQLRGVDRVALYSPQVLEVLLPELSIDDARTVAKAIVAARDDLRVAVVGYPGGGDNAERMLDAAQEALKVAKSTATRVYVVAPEPRVVDAHDALLALTPEMRRLSETIDRLARTSVTVLIQGETGVGKEVVAQALHARGVRADKPIISVNCGSLSKHLIESTLFGHVKGAFTGADKDKKGVFESADGGTVFLDEVGELPEEAQRTLLRVLEVKKLSRVGAAEREIGVDVRVIAATHRDLEEMIRGGGFREDLFYRLNTVTLEVPPLRRRREEIAPLARRFLQRADEEARLDGFDDDALAVLAAWDWPGNVRELRNAVERAVVLADGRRITVADLPDALRRSLERERLSVDESDTRRMPLSPPPPPPPSAATTTTTMTTMTKTPQEPADLRSQLRTAEAQLIIDALERCGGVQSKAAQLLKVAPRTFSHRMRVLGITRENATYVFNVDGADE